MKLLLILALVSLSLPLAAVIYLYVLVKWWAARTRGNAYYGLPIAERRAFRDRVRAHRRFVRPILQLVLKPFVRAEWLDLEQDGLVIPFSASSREALAAALGYRAVAGDVFVVTQMKCGTTWMQQIVYEVLSRGRGDLGDAGHRHLQAVSPWLESARGVAVQEAPRIGEQAARIIKTHLPTARCPYSPEAKYVYVTRHPVSCFLSCLDFTQTNGGLLARRGREALDWFCGERMWWGPWPDHVAGWWAWAQERPNVRFFHFEEMKADLEGTVRAVAAFLEVELDEDELARVVEKSDFAYMKEREEWFEMSPPTMFSVDSTLFASGSVRRDAGAEPEVRDRILAFCRERLAGSGYPAERFYPELGGGPSV